jgi:hypothetical protein
MTKSFFSIRSVTVALAVTVLSATLFTACNKVGDDVDNTPIAALMAFNLAPDKSNVQVALSGSALTNTPLAYTTFTGSYLNIYPGTRSFEAYDITGSPFASTSFAFEPGKYYSAFVLGTNGNYRNVVVHDDIDSLPATSAYIRYINAIPDSSAAVTVKLTAGGTDISNTTAPYASVSAFKAVAPGQVTIDVVNGSTIDKDRTITVEQAKVYTVLLVGVPGSASTPIDIKFITNGTLDGNNGAGRVAAPASGSSRSN